MGRLLMFLFLAWLVLTMVALISCLSADEEQLRGLPRPMWVAAIIFVPFIGAISYFSNGRPQPDDAEDAPPSAGQRLWRTATTALNRPAPARPVAPDDDPDFLATIDGSTRAADDEMLRRWEEEFRDRGETRGEDQRKQDKKIDDSPSDG